MRQKKKTQKMKEEGKSGEGDASMDGMEMLEDKCKVGTSKTPSDSGALAAEFLLEDGKVSTSQSYGETTTAKRMAARMDHWGWEEEEH